MSELDLLAQLSALDPDDVLDGLYLLGAQRENIPSPEIFSKAIAHFNSVDPDIRRQSVMAVGVHWAHVPCFPMLLTLLVSENSEPVIDAAISAIARIGKETPALLLAALRVLHDSAENPRYSQRLKALAYIEARWICGETQISEHAKEILSPEKVTIDKEWFTQTLLRLSRYD